ncbi:hypothetical protein CISIN_1g0059651mg, partial [Citrus sinensis]
VREADESSWSPYG